MHGEPKEPATDHTCGARLSRLGRLQAGNVPASSLPAALPIWPADTPRSHLQPRGLPPPAIRRGPTRMLEARIVHAALQDRLDSRGRPPSSARPPPQPPRLRAGPRTPGASLQPRGLPAPKIHHGAALVREVRVVHGTLSSVLVRPPPVDPHLLVHVPVEVDDVVRLPHAAEKTVVAVLVHELRVPPALLGAHVPQPARRHDPHHQHNSHPQRPLEHRHPPHPRQRLVVLRVVRKHHHTLVHRQVHPEDGADQGPETEGAAGHLDDHVEAQEAVPGGVHGGVEKLVGVLDLIAQLTGVAGDLLQVALPGVQNLLELLHHTLLLIPVPRQRPDERHRRKPHIRLTGPAVADDAGPRQAARSRPMDRYPGSCLHRRVPPLLGPQLHILHPVQEHVQVILQLRRRHFQREQLDQGVLRGVLRHLTQQVLRDVREYLHPHRMQSHHRTQHTLQGPEVKRDRIILGRQGLLELPQELGCRRIPGGQENHPVRLYNCPNKIHP
mmetsp:Transcript_21089/g.53653  ORF Transcript_21089/g.53653 Transcript_21089/m.53653 type:complete len:497 (-) Transcript_21089:435-1925(-)